MQDGGQQFLPEYKALNPMAEVPTLEMDGHVLTQSVAILEYLEEVRPEIPLLPRDPFRRSQVWVWLVLARLTRRPFDCCQCKKNLFFFLSFFLSFFFPTRRRTTTI
jgi:glutathione S-transferase